MLFKSRINIIFAVAMLTSALLLVFTEAAYWLGYRATQNIAGFGSCAVLVPGYPSRSDGTPHPVQRFRVEAGYAAYQSNQCSRLVFSGGAVKNPHVEAESMAEIAQAIGVPKNNIIIEAHARSTWENIGCSQQYLQGYEQILIVSDSLHAHRAKRYACRQDSALCSKIYAVGASPSFPLLWWQLPAAAYELFAWIRDLLVYERTENNNAATCTN